MHTQVTFTGPGDMELETVVTPDPATGELLISPDAVGICGTDLELLNGSMGYLQTGQSSYPIVPGHEWTGTVIDVGAAVTGFQPGDRVVGECTVACGQCHVCRIPDGYQLCPNRTETGIMRRHGALAERLVFPAKAAHIVPTHVAVEDAALIEPLAVAYRGVRRLTGDRRLPLAIIGGGTIGLLSALTARALGVDEVTVIESQPWRRDFARQLGFTCVDQSEDRRWPAVIDAAGTATASAAAISAAAPGGRVLLLGLTGSGPVPVDLDHVVLTDLTVMGSLGSPSVWPHVIDMIASGAIHPSDLVTNTYGLADARVAFAAVGSPAVPTLKVLVRGQ
jgi:L-iditol 2-dehydrogenase